jgi:hypothetical protein
MNILQNAALDYNAQGFATLPVKKNKRPNLKEWGCYQKTKPNESVIRGWFNGSELETTGLAIIAGKVSGNVEVLDIDCKYDLTGSLMEDFCALVKEHLPELVAKLVIAKTVNKGFHILFRSPAESIQGNKKLASRPATGDEAATGDKEKVLIETRGEGGYFVAAPTTGYEWAQGAFTDIPLITAKERDTLLTIARSFDRMPVKAAPEEKTGNRTAGSELSPFDDYNARADIPALLESNGWRFVYQRGENHHYKRPGTTESVTSASFHTGLRLFYVFSTSTEFESGRGFNPVGVYTQLEHGGDYSAASKALFAAGYGSRRKEKPPNRESDNNVNNVNNVAEVEREIGYPKLSDAVFFGLAGEMVKLIAPHTEADNAALLVQFLAGFGNLIGRGAHFQVGADAHYTKLNTVVVGATAAGRKGLSWGEVQRVLVRVDESFKFCIHSGLSSGEGLIHTVRDAQFKKTPVREKGRIVDYQEEMYDEGASEKRAFVVESEFARVLKVSQREGNTLSQVIRDAWDKDFLQIKTKQAVAASNAHISIVGHITREELLRTLADSDLTNGFANRFVWVCSRRSKYLPSGGNLSDLDINVLVTKIHRAGEFAKTAGEITRDAEADALWCEVYRRLSDGHAGLLGSVTSRATAQVLRIACLYSLLDCSNVIRIEHLTAALALWKYCEDSARYIFGAQTGNKIADEIFTELKQRKAGMSKNDIREHFQQNRSAAEINIALELLLDLGRIDSYKEKTSKRPKEIFITLPDVINVINVINPKTTLESEGARPDSSEHLRQEEFYPCLHCGADIPLAAETCPECDKPQLPSF